MIQDSFLKSFRETKSPFITNPYRFAGAAAAGGWVELGRTTLGSTADIITVSSLPDKRYYMYLLDCQSSGGVANLFRLGSGSVDTGSNYAVRRSYNGGTDATHANATYCNFQWNDGSENSFSIGNISNLASKEKLFTAQCVRGSTAGAGNAPKRSEGVGKWTNTSNPLDIVSTYNIDTGNFAAGAEIVVLGWDPADTHTSNFWEELLDETITSTTAHTTSTFTTKKYLWIQIYCKGKSSADTFRLEFGNATVDTGTNYSVRHNYNGTTESANTSTDHWNMEGANTSDPSFHNIFMINNASNEKLGIMHNVQQSTAGAGTAPNRREQVAKWTNTSNQINIMKMYTTGGSSTIDTGSRIKVWGAN